MLIKNLTAYTVAGTVLMATCACPISLAAPQRISQNEMALLTPGSNSLQQFKSPFGKTESSGAMQAVDVTGRELGLCPLKHTDVQVQISGYVAAVTVEQIFENQYSESIEATYTFPLSDSGAINDMTMDVGGRIIKGTIQKRQDAQSIYDSAKRRGMVAALLEQERTNVFTQNVANIPAKSVVKVKLKYVELLPFESGRYTFAFPMVVGPRYMPGKAAGDSGTGFAHDTTEVPDASKISPPIMPENKRSGHDISLSVQLNSALTVSDIKSALHEVSVSGSSDKSKTITLAPSDNIPNRDFVLSWSVAQSQIRSGYLAHKNGSEGFFNLMIVPPARPEVDQICPRELNFIIDRSGSQRGLPLLKARETMLYVLDRLNPKDTFQILSFNNATEKLFYQPMPPSPEAISEAKRYIHSLEADGGTEMRHAVEEATQAPAPANRLRIFTIMTDGLIGNDNAIVALVRKTRGVSRWFSFGTGNSVNRRLIDGVAKAGGGEAQYVLLNNPGEQVAKEFFDRISTPVLSDIKITFKNVTVSGVTPTVLDDVWANRPLYINGKYKNAEKGSLVISGFSGGKAYEQKVALALPESEEANAVLPSIWARAKVEELTESVNFESVSVDSKKEQQEQIEDLGLKYGLLTQYTSFVAVDESGKTVQPSKKSLTVGVEAPDGINLSGVFGNSGRGRQMGAHLLQSQLQPTAGMHMKMAQRSAGSKELYDISPGLPTGVAVNSGAMLGIDPTISAQTVAIHPSSPASTTASSPAQILVKPVIDERHYTSGQSIHNGLTATDYHSINANFRSHRRAGPYDPLATIIVSSLGMPPNKPSAIQEQFASKLSAELKKILSDRSQSQSSLSIRVKLKGNQESLIEKMKTLNFAIDSTNNNDKVKDGILIFNVNTSRIDELLPLPEIEALSVFSK